MATTESTRTGYVVRLGTPAAQPGAGLVGRKAATLARLHGLGFAVPESLVLTTEACAAWIGSGAGALPDAVAAVIDGIATWFGDVPLAVRSSSPREDGAQGSFAGVFDSVLGVRGVEELRRAVLRCWASAEGERAGAYRSGAAGAMAVLVQRQLEPDVAGVAFTADPATGDRSTVLVSAVPGLGDAVAGGTVTPDEWRVRGDVAVAGRAVLGALTAAQAVAVARLARDVEAVLGGPQDIEWAMESGRLVLLQARPVTALPRPPAALPLPGPWVKETDRYTGPMTVLGASLATQVVGAGLTRTFAEHGSLVGRVECRCAGGEIYQRMEPVGGRPGDSPPPWPVLAVLVRTVPALRRRMRAARRNGTQEHLAWMGRVWWPARRTELRRRIAALRDEPLGRLDDAALADHLRRTLALLAEAMDVHFRLTAASTVPVWRLVHLCDRLGIPEAAAVGLVAGTSATTSAPARELARIAEAVRAVPGLVDELRAGADPAVVLAGRSDLAGEYARWCSFYGTRCVDDDPGSPTLLEQPALLAALMVGTDGRPRTGEVARELRGERIVAARRRAAARGRRWVRRLDGALADAELAYGLREDVAFWTGSMCGGLVRRSVLEAGTRLVAVRRLDRAEDAVQLEPQTLVAALAGALGALRESVAAARAERAWVSLHPGPAVVGGPPPARPDLRGLPRTAREVNEAFLWGRATGSPKGPELVAGAGPLTGTAASPGRVTGPVRRVRTSADLGRVRRGDVLLAHTTDPAWSVVFGVVGALVTDSGGLLSHAAIVAREMGVPAVVGVPGTDSLRDGDVVTVDGSRGTVRSTGSTAYRDKKVTDENLEVGP